MYSEDHTWASCMPKVFLFGDVVTHVYKSGSETY